METITSVAAVKQYFSTDGRPVEYAELKQLGASNIKELGVLVAAELGMEIQPIASK